MDLALTTLMQVDLTQKLCQRDQLVQVRKICIKYYSLVQAEVLHYKCEILFINYVILNTCSSKTQRTVGSNTPFIPVAISACTHIICWHVKLDCEQSVFGSVESVGSMKWPRLVFFCLHCLISLLAWRS